MAELPVDPPRLTGLCVAAGDLKRVGSLYDPPPGYKDDLIVWDFFWTRVSGWDARAAMVWPSKCLQMTVPEQILEIMGP